MSVPGRKHAIGLNVFADSKKWTFATTELESFQTNANDNELRIVRTVVRCIQIGRWEHLISKGGIRPRRWKGRERMFHRTMKVQPGVLWLFSSAPMLIASIRFRFRPV